MSFDAETLYRLLPSVHRIRDAEQGYPLRQLIEIIADQVAVLEEELEKLCDNQFVETAAPWVLPYLGDLLGLRGLGVGGGSEPFAPRAEVANTIAYRRRKGTAAMLEQLARDIMDRPAAAVEFWSRLAVTQHVNHVRPENIAWASLRDAGKLEFISTPFESANRTVEVRRVEPGLGKWNIPNVGLLVWRLRDYCRTRSPLTPAQVGSSTGTHFHFHPLGFDVHLCARPETETDIAHLAEPENVPVLMTWRLFAGKALDSTRRQFHPDEKWYGPDSSIQLWRLTNKKEWSPILPDKIIVCDLGDVQHNGNQAWGHDNMTSEILLDPVRGRVVFPSDQENVFATFCTLFPADIGGGEYARAASFGRSSSKTLTVAQQPIEAPPIALYTSVKEALDDLPVSGAIVEIADSDVYSEAPALSANDILIELRARDGCWPVLTVKNLWKFSGNETGRITLNGLLVTGKGIIATDNLGTLIIRHCTIVGGLKVEALNTKVELENCILGPLSILPDVSVRMRNCIVDATAFTSAAISGGQWRIENCTIIGRVSVRGIELASNTIFYGESVKVERRQEGCMRFCWLPENAVVPRRHKCVPRVEQDDTGKDVHVNAQPQFVSLRFGDATYCLLTSCCSDSIRRGADDESEMGIYHDLLEPHREAHLRARLRDYLRFGLDAGIFYEQLTPNMNIDSPEI